MKIVTVIFACLLTVAAFGSTPAEERKHVKDTLTEVYERETTARFCRRNPDAVYDTTVESKELGQRIPIAVDCRTWLAWDANLRQHKKNG